MNPNRYDRWVASLRPKKRPPRMDKPVAAFVEREVLPNRQCGTVGTVILNNRECPYRCVFCGLWQDTIDRTPDPGAVARQVEQSLASLGPIDGIKLYNAGSFFDEAAIPVADRDRIGDLCRALDWVIVESRPEQIDGRAVDFAARLQGRLQIAIGVEIADDRILALLNKRMTLASVTRASRFLHDHAISLRAFVIVQPPLVAPDRAVVTAAATADFAVRCRADTVTMIRAYSTAGAMEQLATQGFWMPPHAWAVYDAARQVLERTPAVTLIDRWSLGREETCPECFKQLDAACETLNTQQRLPVIACGCRDAYEASLGTTAVRGPEAYRDYLRAAAASRRAPDVPPQTECCVTDG